MASLAERCAKRVTAAAKGKITNDDAKKFIDEMIGDLRSRGEKGLVDIEAVLREAGDSAIQDFKTTAAKQRQIALLNIKARKNRLSRVNRFKTEGEGLKAVINGSARFGIKGGRKGTHQQIVELRGKYTGQLHSELLKADLLDTFSSGHFEDDIFQEMYHLSDPTVSNPSGNPDALRVAQIIRDVQTEARLRENRAGAMIGELDDYVMRQTHDPDKVRKAGGRAGVDAKESSYAAWKNDVMQLIDEDRTFAGRMDREKFLRDVHEGILTGVHGPNAPVEGGFGYRTSGALYRKVSGKRLLHFKNAASALAYNRKYGSRDLVAGVLSDLNKSARNTAVMEDWGPNPTLEYQNFKDQLRRQARGKPDFEKRLASLESEFIDDSFDNMMGKLDSPVDPKLHGITRDLMAWQTLSKLGGVTLSAIPDKAFWQMAGTYQGMRPLQLFVEQFRMFKPRTRDEKIQLSLMGAAMDGWLSTVASRFTSATADQPGGTMFRLQQKLFKLNGMNWWNDVHKGAFAKLEAAHLGAHADIAFDSLPDSLSNVLTQYDIDGDMWDIIRSTVYDVGDHKYVTPDQLANVSDEVIDGMLVKRGVASSDNNRLRMRDEMETNLRAFISDQVDDAVVTPGNRESTIAKWGTRAGTPKGMAVRLLMHFKSFPISVTTRVMGREVFGHKLARSTNYRMAQLMALTAIGGYVSNTVKDAFRGKTPQKVIDEDGNPNWDVFARAFLRGGGAGIYGDFLFTEYDRSYSSPLNIAAGPTIGTANELLVLGSEALRGKNVSRSAEKLALGNTPFINLFYIRPILDYTILWSLQETLDPGSLSAYERKVRKRGNQEFFEFARPSKVARRLK